MPKKTLKIFLAIAIVCCSTGIFSSPCEAMFEDWLDDKYLNSKSRQHYLQLDGEQQNTVRMQVRKKVPNENLVWWYGQHDVYVRGRKISRAETEDTMIAACDQTGGSPSDLPPNLLGVFRTLCGNEINRVMEEAKQTK